MMTGPLLLPGGPNHDRRENRAKQEQEAQWQPIEALFYAIEQCGIKTHRLYHQLQAVEQVLREERQDNPDFAYSKPDQQVLHYMFLLFLGAAYILSLLLIYSSTEYLVGLFARGNSVLTALGIALVPIAIIVMQLTIGIDLYRARQSNAPNLIAMQRTAKVAVLITPGMILGTFLAETWGGLPWLPDILLLLVRMALAYITDVGIVSNGEQAFQAKSFFLFGVKHLKLLRQHRRLREEVESSVGQTIRHFQECQQKLASFRVKFPDSPNKLPSYSAATRWVLETWMESDFQALQ
jgi:hypothetical protein